MINKVVLINGNPESGENKLNLFLSDIINQLDEKGISTVNHVLSQKEIKSCVGCWDCWWKTPGICRQKDDASQILRDIINSDLVIFSSPLIMGMYSALIKTCQDRLIPLVHPYVEIRNNECHHLKRYPKYPKLVGIFEKGDASIEEIENVKYILDRFALNFHSEIIYFNTVDQINPKEVSYEISSI